MLSKNGKTRKHKTKIKCDHCKGTFNLEDCEIIKLGDIKYTECVYCANQIILKK